MCFACGDLPSPFPKDLRIVLIFLLNLKGRGGRQGLFGAEIFEGVALKIALIVLMGWALLLLLSLAFFPHCTAWGFTFSLCKGLVFWYDSSQRRLSYVGSTSTWLTLYSGSILLQQGTNIGVSPSTTKRLCF